MNGTLDFAWLVAWLLSMAAALFFAAGAWIRLAPRQGGLIELVGTRVIIVPLGVACTPLIVALAFPAAALMSLLLLALGILIAVPLAGVWYWLFQLPRSRGLLAMLTLLVALAHVGVYAAHQWLHERQMQQRRDEAARAAAAVEKRRSDAAQSPVSREQAVRRGLPLMAQREPYRSVMACVEPMQDAVFRSQRDQQGRWPTTLVEAGIEPPAATCRIDRLAMGAEGSLLLQVRDDQAQDLKRRQDPKCRPEECGPAPTGLVELRLIPHRRDSGALLWLCSSPQSRVFEGLSGCGSWTP